MSELVQTRQADFLRIWLATTSSVALISCVTLSGAARAEDTNHPTVWIELGGQMERLQGTASPFIAPFMTVTPTPSLYQGDTLVTGQRAAAHAYGLEGKVIFQPEHSDWKLSVGILYGRSNAARHFHDQGEQAYYILPGQTHHIPLYAAPYADEKFANSESHAVLDFAVGKDVGLGMFGQSGSSTLNVGVRFAQFSNRSAVTASGRPEVNIAAVLHYGARPRYVPTFHDYQMAADAARSFHGIGPSLSWESSAGLLGNKDDGQLDLDWGINAAVLFGRQKATTEHTTQATYRPAVVYATYANNVLYAPRPHRSVRSRSLAVPNIGGFGGISVKYPNIKVSLGYRADFFFGAVDAGIDERQSKDLGFRGPFATISIGLGG